MKGCTHSEQNRSGERTRWNFKSALKRVIPRGLYNVRIGQMRPVNDLVMAAVGLSIYGAIFAALWKLVGVSAGQAVGLMLMFHLFIFPAFLLEWIVAAVLGRSVILLLAIIAAPILAAWLAWDAVMHTGVDPELIDGPQRCYDRQGPYSC